MGAGEGNIVGRNGKDVVVERIRRGKMFNCTTKGQGKEGGWEKWEGEKIINVKRDGYEKRERKADLSQWSDERYVWGRICKD